MTKPIIALTPMTADSPEKDIKIRQNYLSAVLAAGGLPVLLPLAASPCDLRDYASRFDGFLFTGGEDLDPAYYNEEVKSGTVKISKARDDMERTLFEMVYEKNRPMMGICRGLQLFNVMLGGSLIQDIGEFYKTPVRHDQGAPYDITSHAVTLLKNTPFEMPLGGGTLPVNTSHHQAIKELSAELLPFALSDDGLIEGVCHKERDNFLAVQWHPEHLYKNHPRHLALFEIFINMCK